MTKPNKEKIYHDISDVWVPNPPDFCDKRKIIIDGNPYMDIVICEFFCRKGCQVYYDYNEKLKQDKKIQKKLKEFAEGEIKNDIP